MPTRKRPDHTIGPSAEGVGRYDCSEESASNQWYPPRKNSLEESRSARSAASDQTSGEQHPSRQHEARGFGNRDWHSGIPGRGDVIQELLFAGAARVAGSRRVGGNKPL